MNRIFARRLFPVSLMMLAGATVLMGALGVALAAGEFHLADSLPSNQAEPDAMRPSALMTDHVYLPAAFSFFYGCDPIPDANYGAISVIPPPTDRPAELHADLNLALRGYEPTSSYLDLVDYDGPTDLGAPQLAGLFADHRIPTFSAAYQVHHWDWALDLRGPVITNPDVTLLGMAMNPGELIHVPASGYTIGSGYEVLVLYAAPQRITLKYTGEDNVVWGYTLHLENICVDPSLLALYQAWNDAGRGQLPALHAGQPFAYARDGEIGVAIRDTGAFMDPRSRKDWWQ